ncbi:MAG: hypothetical protein M1821_008848 [Bathelium mastoideum]|nr:MAG: hypothetical protein M1821_008848 [Bathelium mastoideum]
MVYRSARCSTCKCRRVKCDSTLPSCQRCRKAGRICVWDPEGELTLPYKSENVFAQGQSRRLKRGADNALYSIAVKRSLPPSLSITVELHAFHYWAENFTYVPDDLPDIEQEYNSYALSAWNRAKPGSTLHLAVSAYSLAVFGRTRRMYKILEVADKYYTSSVVKMREEIQELSNERIDQLLISTILMTSYENTMYRRRKQYGLHPTPVVNGVSCPLWKDIWHHRGTIGLLHARQQQVCPRRSALDRAVRRPMIRSSILQGETVDAWLQNGALFGEEGPTLAFDALMVRVAAFRSKSLGCFRHIDSGLAKDMTTLNDLTVEAQDLDHALDTWSLGLPEDFTFSLHLLGKEADSKNSLQYEGATHRYATYGHAAIWNRYRAVRLVVNGVRLRLLSAQDQFSQEAMRLDAKLENCEKTINALATDMCRSIPFFFTVNTTKAVDGPSLGAGSISESEHYIPNIAALLTWPLGVAVSIEAVPYHYKLWLRRRLKKIASVLGNDVVQHVAERKVLKI